MTSWRQWRYDSRWRKTGPLALALLMALIFLYYGASTPVRGQESPLATPAPAAPQPSAPSPVVPVQLPSISGVIHDENNAPLAGVIVTAYQNQRNTWVQKRQ